MISITSSLFNYFSHFNPALIIARLAALLGLSDSKTVNFYCCYTLLPDKNDMKLIASSSIRGFSLCAKSPPESVLYTVDHITIEFPNEKGLDKSLCGNQY
jgi:hypothetical protein